MCLLACLAGDRALSPEEQFQRTTLLFQHGDLAQSQASSAELADRYRDTNPRWSAKFILLEAESASWRGLRQQARQILLPPFPASAEEDSSIRRLSLLAGSDIYLHHYDEARQFLAASDQQCAIRDRAVCSHVLDAHATLALEQGKTDDAFHFYQQDLAIARRFGQSFDEATALNNLGVVRLQQERYDEAIDWLNDSNRIASPLGAQDLVLYNIGNLGWAYYSLGDRERALALFRDAERRANSLGDARGAILWLTTIGYALQDSQDWTHAMDSYRQALQLATRIVAREQIINSLESLTHVSIQLGHLDEAELYLHQLDPLVRANANRLDALDVLLARGRIAAARRQDDQAGALFHEVEADPASQITMRLGAEHELARLFESQERLDAAQAMYAKALATFESAREQIRNEDSKIPYFANATPIYDDYIRLLISQGKAEEALAIADQSRARTLAQGLGLAAGRASVQPPALHPRAIASQTGATLLFYWLGERQSWLWAVTSRKITVFSLPSQAEIARRVRRYRSALQGPEDPLASPNEEGLALYRTLVAPVRDLFPANAPVIVLCDGALSELNFETLIVPGPAPHYWIDDASIVSAPSLRMLTAARASHPQARQLLLIGNAVSPGPDYPELANASVEMEHIRAHFHPDNESVFERRQANPASYLQAGPEHYAYIDFVAHGIASRTDPLDSAIVLSPAASPDSFRLDARDIMRHPIDARLVTIAACYGGGNRAYAGEGLVGLSWAFLYAGAHNVIGALWEVSDASTPLLMDGLYQGLQSGLPPGSALRQAKLRLLHSNATFRTPFYWAPFQLYTGR